MNCSQICRPKSCGIPRGMLVFFIFLNERILIKVLLRYSPLSVCLNETWSHVRVQEGQRFHFGDYTMWQITKKSNSGPALTLLIVFPSCCFSQSLFLPLPFCSVLCLFSSSFHFYSPLKEKYKSKGAFSSKEFRSVNRSSNKWGAMRKFKTKH